MVCRKKLEALACPADREIPFFNEHMEIANQHGMNYHEALEFIIRIDVRDIQQREGSVGACSGRATGCGP